MRPRISVCMAAYNGERYIVHQLESILEQLGADDEIVVVDDGSSDDTVARVTAVGDERIRLHVSERNRGYVRAFEQAMMLARNDILLLADQDDEWMPGRVDAMVGALADHAVVASNLVLLGDDAPLPHPLTRRPWALTEATGGQSVRNRARILAGVAPYFGCAMAVRRDALAWILPFPGFLTESHDLWIAIVANSAHEMAHLETPTIRRRLHDANASPSRPRGVRKVLAARGMLLRAMREARRRTRRAVPRGSDQ